MPDQLSLDTRNYGLQAQNKIEQASPLEDLNTSSFSVRSSSVSALADPLVPTNPLPTLPIGGSANPNPNPYLTSAALVPDFNGDGKTDKLWVNVQTGEILVRLMNGTQVLEQASLGKYDLNTWDYKTADFNSDNKTDFLLRNKTTGENVIVLMDGAKVSSFLALDRV
ncbi:MAG: FG-GAP repeat domain-containing protein, partial [Dolichospermum sp.]